MDRRALLEGLALAAREAGEAILAIRRLGFTVASKGDSSPVTEADEAAERIILDALARLAPGVPVVAEEEVAAGRIPALGDLFFLVDPLDGTKDFVAGGADYTVNIGLIENGAPVLGTVFTPESKRLHAGLVGEGAWLEEPAGRRPISVRAPSTPLSVVASKAHMNAATERYLAEAAPGCAYVGVGSSLKFCHLADGRADLYPRLSPTSEWDTAAGHAVLLAAGGRVDGPDGLPLRYRKPSFLNTGFVATGGWVPASLTPFLTDSSASG